MLAPPIPADEAKRLSLLKACNIIYTPAEEAFDDIARLAAEICGTEIALITLVDSDYQWFKARVRVELEGIPRDLSFCGHCITHQDPLMVEDTHQDPRFADNPLVTGEPKLRFYAGVPLLVDAGSAVGAISVADRTPRTLSPRQIESLQRLAQQIARDLRERRGTAHVASVCPIAAGAIVAGEWTIVRELGRGGTGVVFEATNARGGRVALKVLLPQWLKIKEVVERFAREARVLMHLRTPFVAKLLDVGNLDAQDGGLPFLVLEYLEGSDFADLVNPEKPIAVRDALRWCADACEGLAEAHAAGIIHRDLKPSNMFLANTVDAEPVTKVLDFGIAAGDPMAGAGSALTLEHAMIGTPSYMSPEQMLSAHDVDARSDIWSMGTVLYQLLTGERPFRGEGYLQICSRVMSHPPLPMRAHVGQAIAPNVEAVVLKCLRKKREERFDSMHELAGALRAASA